MTPSPPRAWLRLLEAVLPAGVVGRSMVGDLVEEWHGRRPGLSRGLWFASAALALAIRYGALRVARGARAAVSAAGDALRGSVRRPVQTGVTVLALGIGIAAPATMFSIVRGFTGELDFQEPDRVIHLGRRYGPTVIGIAPLDWLWPGLTRVEALEPVGVYALGSADLGDEGDGARARRLRIARVTPGVFGAFGRTPALGRTPGPEADGEAVVLGWELWQDRFGGDPSILGRTLRLDGRPRTVVGVMPEGFRHPGGVELWAPLDPTDSSEGGGAAYQAVGRLARGASLQAVQERVEALNAALRRQDGEMPRAGGLAAEPWRYHLVSAQGRRLLSVMVWVVGSVLVIACADVLGLLLARALARTRETAVRVALGAGRGRIVGQHLAEAAVLAVLAGGVGLALTAAAVRAFEAQTAGQLGYWMEMRMDLPVLLFGMAMVLLAALLTGLLPAAQSGRVEVGPALREGGRGASSLRIGRLGRALVVGEIALSCALLAVAGIMVRGALTTLTPESGYATSEVLTARYELRTDAYGDEAALTFHHRLVVELRGHPAVADAAIASHLPGGFAPRRGVEVEGTEPPPGEKLPGTHLVSVSPSFLSTLEAQPVRGRGLGPEDAVEGAGRVLVTPAFVAERLGGRDPLGARIRLWPGARDGEEPPPWRTVVGVVPPLGLDAEGELGGVGVYLPLAAEPPRQAALMVRAAAGVDPLSLVPELRDRVAELDPDLALWGIQTLDEQVEATRAVQRVLAALFLVFGMAGLLLAAVGLYGLLAFTVRRRVRELGVRIAVGATPVAVVRTAVGGGLLQLAVGMGAGLGLAALVAPLLGQALQGADPHDPLVYAVVAGVLGLTGALAISGPARHALRVDVVEALRTE